MNTMRLDVELTAEEITTILVWLGHLKQHSINAGDFNHSHMVSELQAKIKNGVKVNVYS